MNPNEQHPLIILCPFCSHPWTAQMLHVWDSTEEGDTFSGFFDVTRAVKIEIVCDNCQRIAYVKELER